MQKQIDYIGEHCRFCMDIRYWTKSGSPVTNKEKQNAKPEDDQQICVDIEEYQWKQDIEKKSWTNIQRESEKKRNVTRAYR